MRLRNNVPNPIRKSRDGFDGIGYDDPDRVELLPIRKLLVRVAPRVHHLLTVAVKREVDLERGQFRMKWLIERSIKRIQKE